MKATAEQIASEPITSILIVENQTGIIVGNLPVAHLNDSEIDEFREYLSMKYNKNPINVVGYYFDDQYADGARLYDDNGVK